MSFLIFDFGVIDFLYCFFQVCISLIYALISFFNTLGLIYSNCFTFLMWKLRSLVLGVSFFWTHIFKDNNFSSKHCSSCSLHFWYAVFFILFSLKYFLFIFFSLTQVHILEIHCFNLQIFGEFPSTFLLSTSSLILLWLQNILWFQHFYTY